MANTKHSVAREIIIDRLLQKRCGYSLYQIRDYVNDALYFEGYGPVSITTIRRDLETIMVRYRKSLESIKRSHCYVYRYADPNFTIYSNVLTFGELQHLHSALLSIRFIDPIQGTLTYQELSSRLSDMLDVDPASDPIVLYKQIPTKADCNRFRSIYQHIRTKTPAYITFYPEIDKPKYETLVHPYFILHDDSKYYLLGHDSCKHSPIKIPIANIVKLQSASEVDFIPNRDFPLQDFYTKHLRVG